MKKSIIYLNILGMLILTACNGGGTSGSSNTTAAPMSWHDTKAPFTVSSDNSSEDNSEEMAATVNLFNSNDNGKTIYALVGTNNFWQYKNNSWQQVNLPDSLVNQEAGIANYIASPDGNTLLIFTTDEKLLSFNNGHWSDTQMNNCLGSNNEIVDISASRDYSLISILGDNGRICQYNTTQNKWSSSNIPTPSDSDNIWLSDMNGNGSMFILDTGIPSISQFSMTGKSVNISGDFVAADDLLPGSNSGMMVNTQGNGIVLFSDSKNDFYYYNNDTWIHTNLNVASFGGEYVAERDYGFDTSGKPYIAAALDNNKVVIYYNGVWQDSNIVIPEGKVINQFVTASSGDAMRILISYSDANDDVDSYVMYDVKNKTAINLNSTTSLMHIVFSSNLQNIYGVSTDELKIYKYNISTKQWVNTGFDLQKYADAEDVFSAEVSSDGILNMLLSNSNIVSYY